MHQIHTNRLVHETSPYLLQHAHNPVDWYPWGEEALSRAKAEDKPILLSIGYSACHWCHVMEKECFENEAIAKSMNERFINIKVDREEPPDLDEVYMAAVQVMTGSGGWPMTVFLTPELMPFHAGTYFPPEERGGMPGFPKVLMTVSEYYRSHREEVRKVASQMKRTLQEVVEIVPSKESADEKILTRAFETLEGQFDVNYGGFGGAPKFPNSMALSFLLRYWKQTQTKKALEMVELTLDRMAEGGIYDHLGGGFHRYSVDNRWLVPHFEKMLYDNALLSRIYFEAYQATRKESYRRIGEEVLDYVLREMRSPRRGFYSTQDADSEGEEGKFYIWTLDQIDEGLEDDEAAVLSAYYGVTSQGNFEVGKSVLHVALSPEEVSRLHGIPVPDLKTILERGRKKLFGQREKRTKPGRDEKMVTSWNGLVISSLVDGFKVSGNEHYLEAGKAGAEFILDEMRREGYLPRVLDRGKDSRRGYSEDYAFFIQALLDLYEATFERVWLREANDLNQRMVEQFWDEKNGGFFFSGKENESLIARSKSPYDNAVPSPNSVAAFNLLRLSYLTGEDSLKQKAKAIFHLFYHFLSEHPSGFAQMLSGLCFFLGPEEIGIVGAKNDLRTKSMIKEIYLSYLPSKILSFKEPDEEIEENFLPILRSVTVTGPPAVFVCRGFTCLPPARDEKDLRKILSSSKTPNTGV